RRTSRINPCSTISFSERYSVPGPRSTTPPVFSSTQSAMPRPCISRSHRARRMWKTGRFISIMGRPSVAVCRAPPHRPVRRRLRANISTPDRSRQRDGTGWGGIGHGLGATTLLRPVARLPQPRPEGVRGARVPMAPAQQEGHEKLDSLAARAPDRERLLIRALVAGILNDPVYPAFAETL